MDSMGESLEAGGGQLGGWWSRQGTRTGTEVGGGHSLDRLLSGRLEVTRGQAGCCGPGRGKRELSPKVQAERPPKRTEILFLRWGAMGWGKGDDKKFSHPQCFQDPPSKWSPSRPPHALGLSWGLVCLLLYFLSLSLSLDQTLDHIHLLTFPIPRLGCFSICVSSDSSLRPSHCIVLPIATTHPV